MQVLSQATEAASGGGSGRRRSKFDKRPPAEAPKPTSAPATSTAPSTATAAATAAATATAPVHESGLATFGSESSTSPTSTCEALYGPYPRAIPVPHLSREGQVPPPAIVEAALRPSDMASTPDHRDVGTPDEWVPRDGRLIRLTGRHPFNVEPPLSVHQRHKFLTPSSLHYVRNHGACPRLDWDTHTLAIGGSPDLVPSPYTLGMDELASMPPRELPVTLVCAGNRRKEQNMIRQTIGFNWGAGGVSTNVWKGVSLRDLLLRAGVSDRNMAGRHVEFLGIEDLPNKVGPGPFPEEPWGKLVKYGTSVPLARAMNPAYDLLIAYEANGERLQPDHGYPVRLVIPGYIGGRMVKWLAAISVLPYETRNHYHYHDNRILPPHVTAEDSLRDGWWYKPEHIFNELSINSALTAPDHGEVLDLAKNLNRDYDVGGYAYTGGGRRITRAEVSWDGGVHWHVCTLDQKERPTEYGMYWCWVWWTYRVRVSDLLGAKELWCRAWDESNNCQPHEPTWNLMGMGNNQIFRVKIHLDRGPGGEAVLRFEHPTLAGQQKGGWMAKPVDKPASAGFGKLLEVEAEAEEGAAAAPPPAPAPKDGQRVYTQEEVESHNTEDDLWIVVNDKVYDCTEYLELHPGGVDSITINAGADATEDFVAIHSMKATKMLEKFCIGTLDTSSKREETKVDLDNMFDEDGRKVALNPKFKVAFRLQNKEVLSHDTFMLDFALQSPEHILGLPTGKHVFLSAEIDGETVMRRYTPISSNYDVGCIKFVIKAYPPCERFPRGGKMSQHVDTLRIGDTIDIRGPVGEFDYVLGGRFYVDGEERTARRFNMIAGGTGITPVMQIAAEILRHPEDPTEMSLIFGCREENDLLMRSTLDEWAEKYPEKFRVHYILSDSWPEGWKHSTGFVNKDLFQAELYPKGDDVWNLMCGPPIMLDKGCTPNLVALGHSKERIFSF